MTQISERARILVVDDEPANLKVIREVLANDYRLSFAKSGELALQLIENEPPKLILLDIMMPDMSGFEVCKVLKANPKTAHIPVIFVTALSHEQDESEGFALGAVDYITKPISPAIVRARVKNHLSLVQAEQLQLAHIDLIQRLGRAAEYKDTDTGEHIARMSRYSKVLALAYGMSEYEAEQLKQAAPMHDVGKIGIPDSVLLKPGRLNENEYEHMKQHALIGAKILENSTSPLLQLAHKLALEHHEKWDGTGYPYGLKGEEISIEGRIVTIADVFDALTSKRPYKKAWSVEEAIDLLKDEAGKHFDPQLVDLFIGQIDSIIEIKNTYTS
ncbi:two-component system response regulator [Pseudoalteromonas shioyasakiensis]|jgi:putative two-component system response regulator|uniref:Two-component system response regulator n=1 Tax=Pseudoalteromonas shioyasakiensis TaxID=1190813 RepID=A0ABT6U481_9GAMM|nr:MULTISPECIES: two-component system response regulator [Pseudoalteromonas]MDI4669908.1 two-component system response regulator [Pseudoalteromonas shioyasakiensis]MDI4671967.1 two-component system response regulator [Pseudoalteromonas shioyasakiensis]MDI4686823.1 two-component system response regulator [Pseudoalteromonas shioyasakiensis]MDI4705418.1 two-component system response regulator [Pseudoalteromonas shioyasakiensis]NUJ23004.1 two-component system response regulator [Pseudoalteromonas |tara:strand:+ start:5422 stop:6411 length:990 start_codon:yes stop_codon:yes gene_type:complete